MRAAVELAKDWRTDRMLRRLEAMLAVADQDAPLIITGNGDVLEPELGIAAIGSGGALRPGRRQGAAMKTPTWRRSKSWQRALAIAGDICIYYQPESR